MTHDPAERAHRSARQRRGRPRIVGIPRVDSRGMPRAPAATDHDPETGAYVRGGVLIAYPYPNAAARGKFYAKCRRASIMISGIGEPVFTGAGGDHFNAYRCVGGWAALALIPEWGCVADAHFDCPLAGGGPPRIGGSARDGWVDQRRLPPVPREARRVVRPAVADVSSPGRDGVPPDGPIGECGCETYDRMTTLPPGRAPRAKPSRAGESNRPTAVPPANRMPPPIVADGPAALRARLALVRAQRRTMPPAPTPTARLGEPSGPSYPGINECKYMPEMDGPGAGI